MPAKLWRICVLNQFETNKYLSEAKHFLIFRYLCKRIIKMTLCIDLLISCLM